MALPDLSDKLSGCEQPEGVTPNSISSIRLNEAIVAGEGAVTL